MKLLDEFCIAYLELKAAAGNCGSPRVQAAHNRLAELVAKVEEAKAPPYLIEAARAVHASDDIEIDDEHVQTSEGDGGVWISAWVWIEDNDEGDITLAPEVSS